MTRLPVVEGNTGQRRFAPVSPTPVLKVRLWPEADIQVAA
jgi:hypothetical protein